MRKETRTATAWVVAGVCALAVSGCSSSNGGGSSPSDAVTEGAGSAAPASPAAAAATAKATVDTRSGSLGKILVNDKGRTLYLFKADKAGRSTCSGACAEAWPPLTVKGKPTGGGGVKSGLLATTTRDDGSKQVTYKDQPLYLYMGDHKAGDTNGQGSDAFGAKWWVLDPAGKAVTHKPGSNSSPSKSGGSGY